MKVLIADDEPMARRVLERALEQWGHEPVATRDGLEAWQVLQGQGPPRLAILDWCMPGMNGLDVCRRLRERAVSDPTYVILLTGRNGKGDLVEGLNAGANDYVTKPFDRAELRARLQVGCQVVDLQQRLTARVRELEDALSHVKCLQGLLPICSYCKKVRDDHDYWEQVETYLLNHSGIRFSHGICPQCLDREMQSFGKHTSDNGGLHKPE